MTGSIMHIQLVRATFDEELHLDVFWKNIIPEYAQTDPTEYEKQSSIVNFSACLSHACFQIVHKNVERNAIYIVPFNQPKLIEIPILSSFVKNCFDGNGRCFFTDGYVFFWCR